MSDTSPAIISLTDKAFGALAAGRPSAETIRTLRRAQLSKHLLLLREIARAAPRAAYAELAAAERADPAGVRRLLSDPLFGAWAADCLAALRRGEPADVDHLAILAAAAASGSPNEAAGPGSGTPETREPTTAAGHRLQARHDGLAIDVRLEDADPLRARLGLTPCAPLSAREIAHWRELFAEAWRLLVSHHRADAAILAAVLEVIVPVEPDPASRGISATSAHAFGAVAMSLPADATALAVGVLHETQHSLLNAVQDLFTLHKEPNILGYSPWRDDPRPVSGILHGAYAYLAVTRFWRTEARAFGFGGDPGAPRPVDSGLAAFEFARWRAAVAAAARGLLEDGTLTAAGTRFVTALLDEVRPWLGEAVTGETVRLAEGANTDHYLRWRLRNLAVDAAAVRDLADRWRRGAAPPSAAVRSRLVPAPRRGFESSARLDLAHAQIRHHSSERHKRAPIPQPDHPATVSALTHPDGHAHPPRPAHTQPAVPTRPTARKRGDAAGVRPRDDRPGGRASAGDLAYLRGDYGTAVDAYQKMILNGAGDDAAWAGIALVGGWDEIEVLAAVHRALKTPDVDITVLAQWISS